jgi:hypothetical protein
LLHSNQLSLRYLIDPVLGFWVLAVIGAGVMLSLLLCLR